MNSICTLFAYVAFLVLSFCFVKKLQAQTITHVPLYTFTGDGNFGVSVSGAGDVNGDGKADLVVGAPGGNGGYARVSSGSDGSILYNFIANNSSLFSNDSFGISVSDAGDVNGDGRADLIVGASGEFGNAYQSGRARVLSGIDGSILYNFDGENPNDNFGESVSGAGDVNGDGKADIIVGGNGFARVLSGNNGSVLHNFDGDAGNFNQFGSSVSGAGDVNGDGKADLIVGAPGNFFISLNNGNGSARVLSGSDGSVLYNFVGDSENDYFGTSVSGAGDVNGDGMADVIVGADRVDVDCVPFFGGVDVGSARVLSGSDGSVLFEFFGDVTSGFFGRAVSGAGDVNGDGKADLIVGTPFDSNNGIQSGSARVLSGSDGSVLYNFDGQNTGFSGAMFGRSVSGAGDVNGDGIDDFIVGAGGYAQVFVSQVSNPVSLGDANLDDTVDFSDISPFISILAVGGYQTQADVNQDGMVDFDDISPFIEILASL